jgi:hypothetical protein
MCLYQFEMRAQIIEALTAPSGRRRCPCRADRGRAVVA